ncbi:tripartite tricarboxylate transporter substrate binding protein [Pseudomonas sp. 5P_3.1_Bac2]|uniref:tripartite tricarboxylate transporter substrate binding protein n=1 Tax=Pseudomonas sp. 5P_3.1_Bac2 TaxID=2971617 RepID=UPI0021C62E66|nr:tripartite tricarboxylate transporter substrate binding protein [Pseudomonas sp. 5P_3.1_Bac2]MCU1715914.1 tripartite tricarboxylate transporter substrate binding protein [Pseudomonas sp. 5P_3.1_Bac2]
MSLALVRLCLATSCLTLTSAVWAFEPHNPQCIAPAAPGGSFDLTCKLAQSALAQTQLLKAPLHIRYMPGGVGAVAYNSVVAQRPADGETITAFSSGSLLNLALGKFGRFDEDAVHWLAAIGSSYGAIAVRSDSPYRNLNELLAAIRANPSAVLIGSAGTIGGQDWMQSALLARAAGIDPKQLRYVAMEGGGELATALLSGSIQVASTDIADSLPHIATGDMRVLAVMAAERLPGQWVASIPTAKEQGYDVVWPVIRGFYLGPKVSPEAYAWWQKTFDQLLASKDYAQLRTERQMYPFAMTGAELDAYVKKQVRQYQELAQEFDLVQ